MKRIVIFMFYDYEGIVDDYVKKILSSLAEEHIMDKLVIVTNGKLSRLAYNTLKTYTTHIYERENKGFDGGAYKDTILTYLKYERWNEWDELILMNDTFYGPVHSWKNVFYEMDKQDIDFWGLTRHSGGKWTDGTLIKEHLQGYFLVCRKNILSSHIFRDFWEDLDYPRKLREAVLNFEIHFTTYFVEKGFKYKAYTDIFSDLYSLKGENPYLHKNYELISEAKFPIIKRKTLSVIYFSKAKMVLEFVRKNTDYDVNLIINHLKRLDKGKKMVPFGYDELEEFYHNHDKVYIYGRGKYGQEIEKYFIYKNWKLEKYIVTDNTENVSNTISFSQLNIQEGVGVIIGLNEFYCGQVYPMLKSSMDESQILKPRW